MKLKELIKTFTLRLTAEQHEILERRAEELKLSKNQYIVKLISDDDSSVKKEAEEILLDVKEILNTVKWEINQNNEKWELKK